MAPQVCAANVGWEDGSATESGGNQPAYYAIQADPAFREAYEAATGGTPLAYGTQADYAAHAVEQAPDGAFDHVRGMGLDRPSPYLPPDEAQMLHAINLSQGTLYAQMLKSADGASEAPAPASAPQLSTPPRVSRVPPMSAATPDTVKTQMCPNFVRSAYKRGRAVCPYGEMCRFAHGAEELQPRHRDKRCHLT